MTQIVAMFIASADCACCCTGLEWFFPSIRSQPLRRRDSRPTCSICCSRRSLHSIAKLVALVRVMLALEAMGHMDLQHADDGFGPVVRQPLGLIVAEMFVLGDVLGDWIHRAFHSRALWKVSSWITSITYSIMVSACPSTTSLPDQDRTNHAFDLKTTERREIAAIERCATGIRHEENVGVAERKGV
jgi:hypothetical protein